ncbi:MAG TPA: hypothetical protein VFC41_04915 [Anaerovoracaceae bacterium]|nr:hypothetical protein [Anaerovoracaceae bacterium]
MEIKKYNQFGILSMIVMGSCLIISGLRETVVITTESDIKIKGMHGLTVNYSDIIQQPAQVEN